MDLDLAELALASIYEGGDEEQIISLIEFLEDNYEYEEVMFSIIHTVEAIEDEKYVNSLMKNRLYSLFQKSPNWASMLLLRMVNSESCFFYIEKSLESIDSISKHQIMEIHRYAKNLFPEIKDL